MRARVLLCIPIVLLIAASARAQCEVEGNVRSLDGRALAGVTVRLEGPDLKQPLVTLTDAKGHYVFDDVKPGTRVRLVVVEAGRQVAVGNALVSLWIETVDLQEHPPDPSSVAGVIASEGPSGEVAGIVRSKDGRPVRDARVAIDATTLAETTDDAGRYLFGKLRPGIRIQLDVSAAGFESTTVEVSVPNGSRAEADVALDGAASAEASRGELSALASTADGDGITARPDQVAGIPSLGRKDTLRALQFLPGVAGTIEASSDLYVRGGTPDQSLVTVDGLTIYPFSDALREFSGYNMDAVQSAEFSKGPGDAADGGRLSGALRLTGPSNTSGKPTGFVDLSILGVSALADLPLLDRGSIMFAIRQSPSTSLYNNVLDAFGTQEGASARDRVARFSGGIFPGAPAASSFRDATGRIELKLSPKDRLSLALHDGRDTFNNSRDVALAAQASASSVVPFDAAALPSDAIDQVSDVQHGTARGLSGTLAHQWSPAVSTTVSVARSDYFRAGDKAWVLTSPSAGDESFSDGRGGSAGLSESNHLRETTVRVENSIGVGFAHAISAGGEVSAFDVDYDAQSEVFQTTAAGFTTFHLANLLDRAASGRISTIYAQDGWRPLARLTLSPGVRVSHYDLAGATYFEPRASASYQITPLVRAKAAWSIDHQVANRITREDLVHGDGAFWALADGTTIQVPRAQQVGGGASLEAQGVLVDVEGFYKTLDHLTMFAPRLYPGVITAAAGASLYSGSGTARGLEVLAQKAARGNTVWASYTLSKVEYTYPALEAGSFPASFDQTHEFKLTDTLRIGRWPSLSGAFVVGSGRPYTPASGVAPVWFPSGAAVTEVTFDAKNSARLPAYHRLDLATERDFQVGLIKASLGATLFNVYNHQNVSYYEYETAGNALTPNAVNMMGRAFNVFIRVGF